MNAWLWIRKEWPKSRFHSRGTESRLPRGAGGGRHAYADQAVGLSWLVVSRSEQASNHTPRTPGGQQPVAVAPERAEEPLHVSRAAKVHRMRKTRNEVLKRRMRADSANPDAQE